MSNLVQAIDVPSRPFAEAGSSQVDRVLAELEQNGIVVLPRLTGDEQLKAMQRAFNARLKRVRWNDFEGYERERFRHVVPDLLTLDQGFVDIGIHWLVKETLRRYIGEAFELVEVKGWKSVPTRRDFHGWHGDAWYDQSVVDYIPKEVKLAFYLTDVSSGAFNYIKGSHQQQHPQYVNNTHVESIKEREIIEVLGPAGTAFLFDTSGIHRQSVPILEPRQALFYDYHDPAVRLEPDNVNYRYHPLLLNAAFLGDLTAEDRRILGFGNKQNFIPAHEKPAKHTTLQRAFTFAFDVELRTRNFHERVTARLKRILKRRHP
jgi:hypothetical protein